MRKLLLNKKEVNKVIGRINRDGLTIVPTKVYFKKEKQKLNLQLQKVKNFMTKDMLRKKETGRENKQEY